MNDRMQRVRDSVETWRRANAVSRRDVAGEGPESEPLTRPLADDVTVVVPTLGRPLLPDVLESLARGEVRPGRVIVVHQGDDPRVERWTSAMAGRLNVTYLASDERGRARGLNLGIEHVSTRFVAVTDDDCIVRKDWLRRLVRRLRDEPGRLLTGRVEPIGDQPVAVTLDRFDVQHRPRLADDLLSGGNMAAASDVLRRIGPLDEDPTVANAEDKEYAYRALRAGVAITYDPAVVVGHVAWRSGSARENQYEGYARSLAGFFGKYVRQGDLFIAARVVVHLLRSSKRWLAGVLRGDVDQAANGRAYVKELLPGLLAGWRSNG